MEKIFNTDYVTIIRKNNGGYSQEDIVTRKLLPGSSTNDKKVRESVIARLRQDPSVMVVMEGKNERCEETFEHKGFTFTLNVQDGELPSGRMQISYAGECAYDQTFPKDPEKSFWDSVLEEMLCELEEILGAIDEEFYYFVRKDCPAFEMREPEDEINDIFTLANMLEENHYEVARLFTVGSVDRPCLFVHENELVMLGKRHFYGSFFVEMKRLYEYMDPEDLESAVREAKKSIYGIQCFRYEDGSWGFRTDLNNLYKSTFVKELEDSISELRTFISKVESSEGVGKEHDTLSTDYRALFTYEAVEASLRMSKLHI